MTVYSNTQFVKGGQKIWSGPSPPLNWTKSKRTATSFVKPSIRRTTLAFPKKNLNKLFRKNMIFQSKYYAGTRYMITFILHSTQRSFLSEKMGLNKLIHFKNAKVSKKFLHFFYHPRVRSNLKHTLLKTFLVMSRHSLVEFHHFSI